MLAALAGGVLASCTPKGPGGLDSPLAQDRLEAAVDAAERHDAASVPQLVILLGSDDPAVRMVAIHSLREITGQDLGYDFAGSELERQAAIDCWDNWVAEHQPSTSPSAPASQGSATP